MTEAEKSKIDSLIQTLYNIKILSFVFPIVINSIFAYIFWDKCLDWDCLMMVVFPILFIVQIILILPLVFFAGRFFRNDKRKVSITLTVISLVLSLLPPIALGWYFVAYIIIWF
jgi:hypothetical protein